MPAFNLRGIEPEVMLMLKQESKEKQISVNFLILQFIEQGLGYSVKSKRPRYHELDSLSGTWSEKEAKAFEENMRYFERVDEEMWS